MRVRCASEGKGFLRFVELYDVSLSCGVDDVSHDEEDVRNGLYDLEVKFEADGVCYG